MALTPLFAGPASEAVLDVGLWITKIGNPLNLAQMKGNYCKDTEISGIWEYSRLRIRKSETEVMFDISLPLPHSTNPSFLILHLAHQGHRWEKRGTQPKLMRSSHQWAKAFQPLPVESCKTDSDWLSSCVALIQYLAAPPRVSIAGFLQSVTWHWNSFLEEL